MLLPPASDIGRAFSCAHHPPASARKDHTLYCSKTWVAGGRHGDKKDKELASLREKVAKLQHDLAARIEAENAAVLLRREEEALRAEEQARREVEDVRPGARDRPESRTSSGGYVDKGWGRLCAHSSPHVENVLN